MPESRLPDFNEAEIDTILAEDIDFTGELVFKQPLLIKGRFNGEIKASSALFVGEDAENAARVEVDRLSSKGRIKGDIVAQNRVELYSSAAVDGDVTAPDLVMESGSKLNGLCSMREPIEPDLTGADPPSQPGQAEPTRS